MKILFDNSWNGMTGIGRVSNEILKRLIKDYDVIAVDFSIKKNNPLYPLILSRKIKKYDFDIFISPGFFPLTSKVRSIIFIHDLGHVVNYSFLHRLYMRLIKPLYKNISFIFTDSITIKKDILNWLNGINSNIENFYLNSSLNYKEDKKFSFKEKYLIYPSNFKDHKNHINLIKAFNLLNPITNSYYLVLTGYGNFALNRIIKKLQLTNNILFVGDIDDNLLSIYYLNSC